MADRVDDLVTPCFLVDIDKVQHNAEKMHGLCASLGILLRPMMKTHKCLEIGSIVSNNSKKFIAVSTVAEAEMFADDGYDDIVYSHLFTADKMPRLKSLAEKLTSFQLTIDSDEGLQLLKAWPPQGCKWNVLLMIDVGYGRDGISWDDADLVNLARRVESSECAKFQGLYTHDGHSYGSTSTSQIADISTSAVSRILQVSSRLKEAGLNVQSVGTGSTPTASLPVSTMNGLTEIHPGNFIFYDAQQAALGSCTVEEVAVRVATRIIGVYPKRNQFLIDAGFLATSHDGKLSNGSYCLFQDHPHLKLIKVTQEVGIVESSNGIIDFNQYPVGKLLFLIPYHSCATAAMFTKYHVCSGDKVINIWRPCKGW